MNLPTCRFALTVIALAPLAGCQQTEALAPPSPLPSAAVSAPEGAGTSLSVDGSAFVLTVADGRVLRGRALEGAIVHVAMAGGQTAPARLDSITPDPDQPRVLRDEFETADGQGGWKNACAPNQDGETWGLPVALAPGHPGGDGEITISCISGVVAKCVRRGDLPWEKGSGGEDLAPFHASCVRMARADYCGDGAPHTKEGTSIDNWDDLGIQKRGAPDDSSYVFEAG